MIETVFILLVIYQLKHFLADYPLQGAYMLRKFLGGWDWVLPLAAHAGVHGIFTSVICWFINPAMTWLGLVDFGIHFAMDRIKASPNMLGKYKTLTAGEFKKCTDTILHAENLQVVDIAKERIRNNTFFWWSLGVDQMVHHLTHYFIIWMLVV